MRAILSTPGIPLQMQEREDPCLGGGRDRSRAPRYSNPEARV